ASPRSRGAERRATRGPIESRGSNEKNADALGSAFLRGFCGADGTRNRGRARACSRPPGREARSAEPPAAQSSPAAPMRKTPMRLARRFYEVSAGRTGLEPAQVFGIMRLYRGTLKVDPQRISTSWRRLSTAERYPNDWGR